MGPFLGGFLAMGHSPGELVKKPSFRTLRARAAYLINNLPRAHFCPAIAQRAEHPSRRHDVAGHECVETGPYLRGGVILEEILVGEDAAQGLGVAVGALHPN